MVEKSIEWREFERRVADLFRETGADAVHDQWLAGSQIDVWVTEHTATRGAVRTIVDCKNYRNPAGVSQIREFNQLSHGLISAGHADRALMVAANGYTKPARAEADVFQIVLFEISDLEQLARRSPKSVSQEARAVISSAAAVVGVVREQLRSIEPLTAFDFDGLHNDLSKVLDDTQRTIASYPLSFGLSTAQRRVRGVLSQVEDHLERALDALSYWRQLSRDVQDRGAGFPDTQNTADATSARLMMLREQEQARQMLRNKLRSIEDACARVPWGNALD